jgi:hypothetical protein
MLWDYLTETTRARWQWRSLRLARLAMLPSTGTPQLHPFDRNLVSARRQDGRWVSSRCSAQPGTERLQP